VGRYLKYIGNKFGFCESVVDKRAFPFVPQTGSNAKQRIVLHATAPKYWYISSRCCCCELKLYVNISSNKFGVILEDVLEVVLCQFCYAFAMLVSSHGFLSLLLN